MKRQRLVRDHGQRGFGVALRTRPRRRALLAGTLAGLAGWQVLALVVGATTRQGRNVVPTLWTIMTEGITGLSHFYRGGWGAATTLQGAPDSAGLAALAVLQNSLVTLGRFGAGYLLAVALAVPAGLLVAAARPVRQAVGGVAGLLRMLPLLAMSPLFTLWFGASSAACVAFVTFGAFWVVLLSTANAVENLPRSLVDQPRTLGLGPVRLRLSVILPAIGPELRGPLMLAAGTAWACVLASELYGVQSGLGWALNQTLVYSLVPQMLVVAAVFTGLSLSTLRLVNRVTGRLTRWSE
ncbi:ABC transporter permease subunit [Kineosporia sp. J2-2]|uniref:ABC transporter permease subunit n=1 Tax=Kineosporia corallincola TaxID=2835133 RepID=A0ABS5TDH1_9ACTN|nr:ABC transporter permease subunit [Kineosporia corallincola]MBT0769143.1 ABC transporter permease subunit [Kineosporia corallincola]